MIFALVSANFELQRTSRRRQAGCAIGGLGRRSRILQSMLTPSWTDTLQAITSSLTTVFTGGSLWFLWRYTDTTQKAYLAALKNSQEALRPVLILAAIRNDQNPSLAILKNTGTGVAINISRTGMFDRGHTGFDNVLAPGQSTEIPLPEKSETLSLEFRYESLAGAKFCTLSAFEDDGSTYNDYIGDLAEVGQDRISQQRMVFESHVVSIQSAKVRRMSIGN